MNSYVISCCSTADLTEEHFSKREISYICFHYKLNDTEYADDLGKSMPFDQFYAAMAAGASTKTSQVNADEFEAYFASLSKSDYSEEDWAKIESQYTYYKNALNAAQTTADMDRALAAFKQKVEAIEKVEPKASNNVGLIVGISVAAAVVVAGAATGIIIAVKKKKEK